MTSLLLFWLESAYWVTERQSETIQLLCLEMFREGNLKKPLLIEHRPIGLLIRFVDNKCLLVEEGTFTLT